MAPHKKQKCKYWAKCYRKDAQHKKDFLHPGDEDEDKKKTADDTGGDTGMIRKKNYFCVLGDL